MSGLASTSKNRRVWRMTFAASSCVLAAVALTGVGLLAPGEPRGPLVRYVAVGVALVAVAVLVRLEGPARASARLVTVAVAAALVCLATFPASPVTFTLGDDAIAPGLPDADGIEGGTEPGRPGGGTIEGGSGPGGAVGGGINPGVLFLPEGGRVTVEGDAVILELPDGSQVILGEATGPAAEGTVAGDTEIVVEAGAARRVDGGSVGPGIGLGGLTLERSDGSRAVIGEGTLLEVPDPTQGTDADSTDALLAVILAALALLAFSPPLLRFSTSLAETLVDVPEPEPEPDADGQPEPITIEEGLASVLRAMLADPDPRTAVIGAYARLLAALAEAGVPRHDAEGPHEHLWRTLGPLGVRSQPVHQLAELFVRARFTPKPIGVEHRQRAIDALADAVGDLRLRADGVTDVAIDVQAVHDRVEAPA